MCNVDRCTREVELAPRAIFGLVGGRFRGAQERRGDVNRPSWESRLSGPEENGAALAREWHDPDNNKGAAVLETTAPHHAGIQEIAVHLSGHSSSW